MLDVGKGLGSQLPVSDQESIITPKARNLWLVGAEPSLNDPGQRNGREGGGEGAEREHSDDYNHCSHLEICKCADNSFLSSPPLPPPPKKRVAFTVVKITQEIDM